MGSKINEKQNFNSFTFQLHHEQLRFAQIDSGLMDHSSVTAILKSVVYFWAKLHEITKFYSS